MSIKFDDLINYLLLNSGQYIGGLEYTLIDKDKLLLLIKVELEVYSRFKPLERSASVALFNNKTFTLEKDGFVPETITRIQLSEYNPFLPFTSRKFGDLPRIYWEYNKPTLLFQGLLMNYSINYTISHYYNEETLEFPTLDFKDIEFLNLCLGKFLISIGKARRSILTQDFPLQIDAEAVVSEGTQIYQDAFEYLRSAASFYLATIY